MWWIGCSAVIRLSDGGDEFGHLLDLLRLLLHRVSPVEASNESKNVCMLLVNCCISHCSSRRSTGWHGIECLVESLFCQSLVVYGQSNKKHCHCLLGLMPLSLLMVAGKWLVQGGG